MSVLEGGIYFEELAGLPSRHLALLMLGLLLALLGAISMGIAGFIAEKPEQIFQYSKAASQLAATDGQGHHGEGLLVALPAPSGPATVDVIVEKLHAATGRVDRLSSPVHRAGGSSKNGYFSSGGGNGDLEAGKQWWQQDGSVTQVRGWAGACRCGCSHAENAAEGKHTLTRASGAWP
jgi:hypothetical protein